MFDYFKERNIELENVDHKVIRDYLLILHKMKEIKSGGRGIRTPVPVARKAIFKPAALSRSAIPPK